jgi:hypothetical protein
VSALVSMYVVAEIAFCLSELVCWVSELVMISGLVLGCLDFCLGVWISFWHADVGFGLVF